MLGKKLDTSDIYASTPQTTSPPPSSSSSSGLSTGGADEEVKLLFLGSAKTGKTSIIQRFLHNRFDSKYTPTVEDVHLQKFVVQNYLIKLVLIDTSGSYDFPAMLRLCISKANAFVLVFAHDNIESLHQAGRFLAQIKSLRKDYAPLNRQNQFNFDPNHITSSPPIVVVCNKSDLPNCQSQISEGAIMEWLLTNGLKPSQFVYASAKSNDAIMSIFKSLWLQNSLSKSIQLVEWNTERRASLNNQQFASLNATGTATNAPTTNSNLKDLDFSVGNHQPHAEIEGTKELATNKVSKLRTGIFRSSLRLSRRSSGKATKCKPDLIYLNCNIS